MSPREDRRDGPLFREETERFRILRLVTEVRRDGVYVRFAPLQRSFRRIPVGRIRGSRISSYSARAYAGWHWGMRRTSGGNTVYRLRGDRGVELDLTGGERCFVGSQRPEELDAAIARIRSPVE